MDSSQSHSTDSLPVGEDPDAEGAAVPGIGAGSSNHCVTYIPCYRTS